MNHTNKCTQSMMNLDLNCHVSAGYQCGMMSWGLMVHLVSRYIYQQLITLLVTVTMLKVVLITRAVLRCDITSINIQSQ